MAPVTLPEAELAVHKRKTQLADEIRALEHESERLKKEIGQ